MSKYTDVELKSMAQIVLDSRRHKPARYWQLITYICIILNMYPDDVLAKIKEYASD